MKSLSAQILHSKLIRPFLKTENMKSHLVDVYRKIRLKTVLC